MSIPYHPKDKVQIHFEKPYNVQTIHCIEFFWYKLDLHKTLESFILSGSPTKTLINFLLQSTTHCALVLYPPIL
jgi:hypothetical protein